MDSPKETKICSRVVGKGNAYSRAMAQAMQDFTSEVSLYFKDDSKQPVTQGEIFALAKAINEAFGDIQEILASIPEK